MKLKAFLKKREAHTITASAPGAKISLWGLRAFISHVADGKQVTQVTPAQKCRFGGRKTALLIDD
jgi:hypothetical protein